MKKRYLFIEPDGDISQWMFDELDQAEDVDVFLSPCNIRSPFLNRLKQVHFSHLVNRFISLPFKQVWHRCYTIANYPFLPDTEYYIVIGNYAITFFDLNYLEKLRSRPGLHIRIVLYFTSTVHAEYGIAAFQATKKFRFDYIYTFDPEEARRYGFYYTGLLYSMHPMERTDITSDLYYIGVNKENRLSLLRNIHKHLSSHGKNCDFYLPGVKESDILPDGIHYNQRFPYREVVQQLQQYHAILEIQEAQSGVTLRYFEAVCYNKKLITNNAAVKNLPFYSPENMLIFQKPEDIDPAWISAGTCDYGYSGEFSPITWIHRIGSETLEENHLRIPGNTSGTAVH